MLRMLRLAPMGANSEEFEELTVWLKKYPAP
jgi:hypothetical protein